MGALVFLGGAEASASPSFALPMFITIKKIIILHLFLGVPAATVGGTGTPWHTRGYAPDVDWFLLSKMFLKHVLSSPLLLCEYYNTSESETLAVRKHLIHDLLSVWFKETKVNYLYHIELHIASYYFPHCIVLNLILCWIESKSDRIASVAASYIYFIYCITQL